MKKPIEVAQTYYAAFRGQAPLREVPMASDLRFASPRFQLDSAEAFRGALTQLLPRVQGLHIRNQLEDGDFVVTLYDLDLGTPGGPIPMAERLRVQQGRLVSVDLIFDSARLPAPPPPSLPQ